jgi:DNA/RNA-binding domain of Phe-tRNA-synthetase-like protein
LKGQSLPNINRIVDIYNAISLKYVIPVGGEDLDKLTGDLVLRFAEGDESFVNFQNGEEVLSHPDKGEVIWADPSGVTCRRWNWRQCTRTALVEQTRNAYFVLDRLAPYPVSNLESAAAELQKSLKEISPQASIECETLLPR